MSRLQLRALLVAHLICLVTIALGPRPRPLEVVGVAAVCICLYAAQRR